MVSSNLPLIRRSRKVLPFLLNFQVCEGGRKLEVNIPPQQIYIKSKGGLIIEGGVMSSEYGKLRHTCFIINAKIKLCRKY